MSEAVTERAWTPAPVDTTDPHAIVARLADIEDRLAFVSNELSRAAYWRKKYELERQTQEALIVGEVGGANADERKANVIRTLMEDPASILEKQTSAEASYAKHRAEFDGLDSRRSILQSALKVHIKEQEPRYGEGSHHR